MALPKKPEDVDDFIKGAKAEKGIENEITQESSKTKKFLIELPYNLWMKLKLKAVQEDKSLKQVILEILEKHAN